MITFPNDLWAFNNQQHLAAAQEFHAVLQNQKQPTLEQNWKDLALNEAQHLPEALSFFNEPKTTTDLQKASKVFTRFLPNLIDTFFEVFEDPNEGNAPLGRYDQGKLLDIYTRFLAIPWGAFVILDKYIQTPKKIFLTTFFVYATALLAIYLYVKHRKPPQTLPWGSKNLSTQDDLDPVINRDLEARRVEVAVEHGTSNIVLTAPSGVGKTTTVNKVAALLPRHMTLISINTAKLDENSFQGYTERMSALLDRIQGYEDRYVFFLDQVETVMQRPMSSLSKYLLPLLDEKRKGVRFIVALTDENHQQLKGNKEFFERFKPISLDNLTEVDIFEMLLNFTLKYVRDIPIDPAKLKQIASQGNITPRQAFKQLEDDMEKARLALTYYVDKELQEYDQKMRVFQKVRLLTSDRTALDDRFQEKPQPANLVARRNEEMMIRKRLQYIQDLFKYQIDQRMKMFKRAKQIADLHRSTQLVPNELQNEFIRASYLTQRADVLVRIQESQLPPTIKVRV